MPLDLRSRLFARIYGPIMRPYEREIRARKLALFADLPSEGTILEIGPGLGANLAFLPDKVGYIALEPNRFMHRGLRDEAARLGHAIEIRAGSAEAIESDDASMDAVISTLVLCSVPDPRRSLAEIRRVLKPGGRFFFIEHVAAAPRSFARGMQRFVKPVWHCLADGCNPDRETGRTIEEAGFARVEVERFQVPFPIIAPHVSGRAWA